MGSVWGEKTNKKARIISDCSVTEALKSYSGHVKKETLWGRNSDNQN